MERLISVKPEYASLDKIVDFVKKETNFDASKAYDHWEVRTDANGEMAQCVVIKKSSMHGAKLYFAQENTLKIVPIIPNKLMNAFFGKSQQKYQNIGEMVMEKIRELLLSGAEKKAFDEIIAPFEKITT